MSRGPGEDESPPPVDRLVILTNIASPYRLSTWDAIARQSASTTILLCAESEADRIWQTGALDDRDFEAETLPGRSWFLAGRGATIHWNPSILRRLKQLRPTHLIVTGYDTPTHLAALIWARLRRVPCAMWTGSHSKSHVSRSRLVTWVRRAIHRLPQAFLTYGTASTETLLDYGVAAERVATGRNAVDVDDIARLVEAHGAQLPRTPPDEATPMRFLFIGQLIERKGVRPLLDAFSELPAEQAVLSIVGYGELEESLRARVRSLGLENVTFEGATRSVEETARFLADADVLVMPSLSEVWGLVLNEGLAAGLFVIASSCAGASPDLIETAPLRCGLTYDPEDPEGLVNALRRALELRSSLDRRAIAEWGRSVTPQRYADAAIRALQIAERSA